MADSRILALLTESGTSGCLDCRVPFCHQGCPLGNLIPDWLHLLDRDDWQGALELLHATNNFPEFTGRLCPAPCEDSCVVGIDADPVAIRELEAAIIDRAWADRRVTAQPAAWHTGRTVAVIGSGPAGLAAAQQLTRAGHTVVVHERQPRIGGLLADAVAQGTLEADVLERRLKQMRLEGTVFKAGVDVGVDLSVEFLLGSYDATLLATGSTAAAAGSLLPADAGPSPEGAADWPRPAPVLPWERAEPVRDSALFAQLGLSLDSAGLVVRSEDFATARPGVFVCGDAARGPSNLAWAIAEGRSCAHHVDAFLQGGSQLPVPIRVSDRGLGNR